MITTGGRWCCHHHHQPYHHHDHCHVHPPPPHHHSSSYHPQCTRVIIPKEKHNWCQEERLVFQLSLKSSLTPPDLFQALKLQFWPKLSITLHSLPDSQSHSKSLSELTLSSSRLAKSRQQAPRDSFQVQNFRFTKL